MHRISSLSGGWQQVLHSLMAGTLLVAWFSWQPSVRAEAPTEPDEYVIVSDESDVASAEAEEPVEAATDAGEPERLPAAEASGDANAAEDASRVTTEVAPLGQPASEVPTAARAEDDDEPTEAASDAETAVSEDEASELSEAEPQAEPQAASHLPAEGASFRSVLPAVTTAEELKAAWGPAKEIRKTDVGFEHLYYSKPFQQVVVTVIDDKVDTILIRLEKEFEPKALARQLMLDDVEPATIYNTKGQMLGMAFPERGVLFGFAAGVPVRVGQIVLEPVNSQPFVTRAEKNVRRKPAEALADATYAIEIDPHYDRAHGIHAQVLMQLGEYGKALAAIDKALERMPDDAEHQWTRAEILYQTQRYDEASRLAAALAENSDAPPLISARAEKLCGDLRSHGPERKFDEAIQHHTEAIRRAEAVSTTSAGPLRRAAKELLVEAHVAVAHDIAWGNWRQKAKVVPRWIDRATGFCDNLIESDFGEECVRLRLLEQTLHAYAGMKDAPDVTATVDATIELAATLSKDMEDPRQREVLQWQLGEALASAMVVYQQQGKAEAAMQLGQRALTCFDEAGAFRTACSTSDFLTGKIYYRLGALRAVEHDEHVKAVAWYDKAIPLLERPLPLSAQPECGQTGESFVSMAVSYWEAGEHPEAIRLTQQGASLMESAVRQFGFPSEALSVPYGNLASMHERAGNAAESKRFAEMAAKAEAMRR